MFKKNSKKIVEQITFATKYKKIILTACALLVITIILGAGIYSVIAKNQTKTQAKKDAKLTKNSVLLFEVPGDIVLGDKNATITIIEYASLSCPHCANFYNNVFEKIKKQYIDTNKVKFIYRDFPLNQSALLASIISNCRAKNEDANKYYTFIKVLFKTQDSWAFSENFFEKLRSIAILDGMSSAQFDACAHDQKIVEDILAKRLKASKELTIDSTPTFIINGKKFENNHEFDKFKEIINNELKSKNK